MPRAFRNKEGREQWDSVHLAGERAGSATPAPESSLVPVPLGQGSDILQKLFTLSKPQIPYLQIKTRNTYSMRPCGD